MNDAEKPITMTADGRSTDKNINLLPGSDNDLDEETIRSTANARPWSHTVRPFVESSGISLTLLILALIYTFALADSLVIPIVLALLLSLVLAPLARQLQRLHVPRSLSAALVVLSLIGAVGYGISILKQPAIDWIEKAPRLLREIERDIVPFKETVEDVSRTAEQVDRMTSVGGTKSVRISGTTFQEILYSNAQDLVTGTVITVFMLYFFLAWGRIMLRHIGEALSQKKSHRRFLELAHILELELSKYLLTITLINIGLGALVAGLLKLLEMPNPLLWGTMAAVLNFVPYIGSFVTAVLILAAAVVSFDGMVQPIMITGGFLLLTTLEGQVITPEILGRSLALNPLVVFLSIIFWFWLWGPIGAFMAVPILLALKIIGERIDRVQPIAALVGR